MSWRTRRIPKPKPAPAKKRQPIVVRRASRHGDHRAKVKYADDLWRRLIYTKEPSGLCPRCRKRKWSDAAHGWIRTYFAVRWEPDNGIPLCRPCHRTVDSDHSAKAELWLRYIGRERYAALELRALARGKVDIDLMILWLEKALEVAKRV